MTLQRRARIISAGSALPDTIVTNKDLEKTLDTSDEWIFARTGIRERRIVADGQQLFAYELGACAARTAMERAGIDPAEIDAIICATFTPDYFFPSTACKIQALLGCPNAFGVDISAACSGFVYGLTLADSLIAAGRCSTILLIGTEIISKALDWTDRSTAILFGDAAGAVVLQACDASAGKGVLSTYLRSDGTKGDMLYLPAWGEKRFMKMNGGEIFKHAVRMMSEASHRALEMAGLTLAELDLLIPHQANIRILHAIAGMLDFPISKVVCNLERYGNTSSASIPIALESAWNQGKISSGTTAVFTSLGGGIAVGSAAVRF